MTILDPNPESQAAADPSDPYERAALTFPRLSGEQAARVASYGREESLPDGAHAFGRGQRSVDFFLVLGCAIEIFDLDKHGAPNVFTTHVARQLTGETDLFNDRQILVSGRARGDTRVIRVQRRDLRPSPHATMKPGIFAVGDARSGSVKHLACGVA